MRQLGLVISLIVILTGCMEEDSLWKDTAPTLAPTVSPVTLPTLYAEVPLSIPGMNNPIAAALPPNSSLPPVVLDVGVDGVQSVQLSLLTGETVIGYLYQLSPEESIDPLALLRSAGVLLLGEVGTDWGILPDQLLGMGYTVLVLNVPELSVADFHNVFSSLQVTTWVDPGAMAVIGFGSNADVALLGCAETLGCDALMLINPSSDEQMLFAMTQYNPRPVLIVPSSVDNRSRLAGESLFEVSNRAVSDLIFWREDDPAGFLNEMVLSSLSRWLAPILESELNYIPAFEDGGFIISPNLDAPIDLNLDLDLDVE